MFSDFLTVPGFSTSFLKFCFLFSIWYFGTYVLLQPLQETLLCTRVDFSNSLNHLIVFCSILLSMVLHSFLEVYTTFSSFCCCCCTLAFPLATVLACSLDTSNPMDTRTHFKQQLLAIYKAMMNSGERWLRSKDAQMKLQLKRHNEMKTYLVFGVSLMRTNNVIV